MMSGTQLGSLKAARTNKKRHGLDANGKSIAHQRAGSAGGKAPHSAPRGFAAMTPEQRRKAGQKGGTKSRKYKILD